MNTSIIEINKKNTKAGRTPLSMVLHKIHKDDTECNKRGITWIKEYCENNLESINGMPLVAQFIDDEHEIPFGDHGNMIVEANKISFEDSLVVGSFESGYIAENIEVNGESIDAVVGVGYIYNQRFPKLVDYLQEEYDSNNIIEGSVEINATSNNKNIIYDGGWKEKFRKPKIFDYSGHALVIGTVPADNSALLLELNSYKKEDNKKEGEILSKVNNGVTIEINKLAYHDIVSLVSRAFNSAMGVTSQYYYDFEYEQYRFYPETSEVIFHKYRDPGKYYLTTYKIDNSTVTIGEISQVEEDWKPVSGASVEVNIDTIQEAINKKGGNKTMGVEELNAKITELTTQVAELNTKIIETNSINEEKEAKIVELNATVVQVNKSLEEVTEKHATLEVEFNSVKEAKEAMDAAKKKAEVNAYFETEIPKNRFEEAEVNSLKDYVEKCDLDGLIAAEAALIVKRFKEGKLTDVEINSSNDNDNVFFHTKEEKLSDIEAGKALFN